MCHSQSLFCLCFPHFSIQVVSYFYFLPLRNAGKSSPSLSGCILLKSSPKPVLVCGLWLCLCDKKEYFVTWQNSNENFDSRKKEFCFTGMLTKALKSKRIKDRYRLLLERAFSSPKGKGLRSGLSQNKLVSGVSVKCNKEINNKHFYITANRLCWESLRELANFVLKFLSCQFKDRIIKYSQNLVSDV